MSFISHSDRTFFGASFRAILSAAKTSLSRRRAQRRAHRVTVRELAHLTDRALADAGLHREVIRDIARDAAQVA